MFAAQVFEANVFEHFHATRGRAAHESRLANHERADVLDMKSIHVFVRGYGFEHILFGNVFRQRQLHEDAVNARVFVERVDHREEFRFGRARGHFVHDAVHADLGAARNLVPHVDL